MGEHTPGPWRHDGVPNQSVPHAVRFHAPGRDLGFMVLVSGTSQAWVNYESDEGVGSMEEAEANATLIAAAPALLEAAEAVQMIISESHGVDGWHLNGETAFWGEFGEVEQLNAAIAAARPEAAAKGGDA